MEEYLEDKETVKTIDADVLRRVLLGRPLEFCEFTRYFAWIINHKSSTLKTALKNPNSSLSQNIFDGMDKSDIAYALLLQVIKREVWLKRLKKRDDSRKGSGAAAAKAPPKKKQKQRKGGNKSDDAEKEKRCTGKEGWLVANRAADRKQGFQRIGVVFYKTVKAALKEISSDEYKDAWHQYYETLDCEQDSNGGHVAMNGWEKKRKAADDSDSEDESGEVEVSRLSDCEGL